MKPDKENGFSILDQKLYNNTTQEIISDTFKFQKLNENRTLKRKLKQKNFFNEN